MICLIVILYNTFIYINRNPGTRCNISMGFEKNPMKNHSIHYSEALKNNIKYFRPIFIDSYGSGPFDLDGNMRIPYFIHLLIMSIWVIPIIFLLFTTML